MGEGKFSKATRCATVGVTGAAPAWHDIMVALHAKQRSRAPVALGGVTQVAIAFEPPVGTTAPRWFVVGTNLRPSHGSRRANEAHRRSRQRPDHRDRPRHTGRPTTRTAPRARRTAQLAFRMDRRLARCGRFAIAVAAEHRRTPARWSTRQAALSIRCCSPFASRADLYNGRSFET
jgi:hypothetical protein